MRTVHRSVIALSAAVVTACGGGEKTSEANRAATATSQAPAAAAATAAPTGPVTPGPGGRIIPVELISDAAGNYFKPSEITAKRGDVIRYTLKVGVHNVHFLADSNAGKTGYPQAPSEMLQLPGQTYDVLVSFGPGKFYFQCDPHAALGMRGHVNVQ